jgi:hypothetical protein
VGRRKIKSRGKQKRGRILIEETRRNIRIRKTSRQRMRKRRE